MTRTQYKNKQYRNFDSKANRRTAPPVLKWKWDIIPGARCPACNKNNHNVYKTGCPSLAVYTKCKQFHEKHTDEEIAPVIEAYNKYQKELNRKLKERRNNDCRMIRTLHQNNYPDNEINDLKEDLFQQYKSDFPEEQYNHDKPLDVLEDEASHESDEE